MTLAYSAVSTTVGALYTVHQLTGSDNTFYITGVIIALADV